MWKTHKGTRPKKHQLRWAIPCLWIAWMTTTNAELPKPITVLQESHSPKGMNLQTLFIPNHPVTLVAKNPSKEILWTKFPGDEATIQMKWDKTGDILYFITNNQEADRDLWAPQDDTQNQLFLIDPRDGTVIQTTDLDNQIFQIPKTERRPREHSFTIKNQEIEISTEIEGEITRKTLPLSEKAIYELKKPKKTIIQFRTSWE